MTKREDNPHYPELIDQNSLESKSASMPCLDQELGPDNPPSDPALMLAKIDLQLAWLNAEKAAAAMAFEERGHALKAVADHPNAAAYAHGGVLSTKGCAAQHVLPFIGFADLPWRIALTRIADMAEGGDCVLTRIRIICEQDAALEEAGVRWCRDKRILRNGEPPKLWFTRPKLGLGQPAKANGLKREDVPAHRGIYALGIDEMIHAFSTASSGQHDLTFGAMLPAVTTQGGEQLHEIGVAAVHADAEARYLERKRSFAARQAATPDRDWRSKPPTSRQGHLAITTARKLDVDLPSARHRGDAADWLDDHGANLRFDRGEK